VLKQFTTEGASIARRKSEDGAWYAPYRILTRSWKDGSQEPLSAGILPGEKRHRCRLKAGQSWPVAHRAGFHGLTTDTDNFVRVSSVASASCRWYMGWKPMPPSGRAHQSNPY